ncbi:MAG: ATP synthase F1 subunit delta [Magnetococcales bacterium]|nr:ATP synthase F1 subunit delta [Magnetococcales bacterium]MBF0156030.1 ATP synthase F1 subunit delta [Magnetococcales bacterium]
MQDSTLAKRYAKALAELAVEAGNLDAVGEDLKRFQEVVAATPHLLELLTDPAVAEGERLAALVPFIAHAKPARVTANFLNLLVARRRMVLIEGIIAAFNRDVEVRHGRVTAFVTTAKPLTQAHSAKLQSTLAELTRKEVLLEVVVAPELLGGLVIRIGSMMMDYSIRSRLNRLKAFMRE